MFSKSFGVIYVVTNKLNGKEYVGQTEGKLKRRFNRHCNETACPALNSAIKKYGRDNFVITAIQECGSKTELNIMEKHHISLRNSEAPNGYNLTPGGQTIRPDLPGRKLTQREKEKISTTLKKKMNDPVVVERLRMSQPSMIQIVCHQNGVVYFSVNDAARKLGLTKSKILDNLNGKAKHTKGYSFSVYFKDDPVAIKPMVGYINPGFQHNKKKAIQDQNGKRYRSISDAAKELNTDREFIRRVLVGQRKSYKGYTFSYVQEGK
jgi:hypothetical protein